MDNWQVVSLISFMCRLFFGKHSSGAMLNKRYRLLFPGHDKVDGMWSTIAKSVAGGPLKDSGVMLAKVAPTPSSPAGDTVSSVPFLPTAPFSCKS